ncbi:hypothetical protein FSP39_023283 [Pinctada imbricata]|uniref:Uncharacterized protein n=1 Tax=Pinctada imbricata TaxID=66713 RepID=A0AA89BU80_PINIB|nr:hypothetical protein FSP39_023283 [Pinctada imbricata]
MYHEFSRQTTGAIPDNNGYHQPIIDGSQRKHVVIREEIRTLPKRDGKQLLNSYGDSPLMSGSSQELFPLTKKDFCTRKDTARKNLMGFLYSRQPTITRSNSFIAGEKPSNDSTTFPRLHSLVSRERTSIEGLIRKQNKNKRTKFAFINVVDNPSSANQVKSKYKSTTDPVNSRPGTQKVSLPDLIMDLNAQVEQKKVEQSVSSDSASDSDYDHHDPKLRDGGQEEHGVVSFLSKHVTNGGKIYPARHRPLTPGLLDRLGKLKLPSRVRTEQWVRRLPADTRLYDDRIPSFRSNNSSSTSKDDIKWIYTNT